MRRTRIIPGIGHHLYWRFVVEETLEEIRRKKYVRKPQWFPITQIPCYNINFFLKDDKSGLTGMGKIFNDGTFKWEWGTVKPTHYWSF